MADDRAPRRTGPATLARSGLFSRGQEILFAMCVQSPPSSRAALVGRIVGGCPPPARRAAAEALAARESAPFHGRRGLWPRAAYGASEKVLDGSPSSITLGAVAVSPGRKYSSSSNPARGAWPLDAAPSAPYHPAHCRTGGRQPPAVGMENKAAGRFAGSVGGSIAPQAPSLVGIGASIGEKEVQSPQ